MEDIIYTLYKFQIPKENSKLELNLVTSPQYFLQN